MSRGPILKLNQSQPRSSLAAAALIDKTLELKDLHHVNLLIDLVCRGQLLRTISSAHQSETRGLMKVHRVEGFAGHLRLGNSLQGRLVFAIAVSWLWLYHAFKEADCIAIRPSPRSSKGQSPPTHQARGRGIDSTVSLSHPSCSYSIQSKQPLVHTARMYVTKRTRTWARGADRAGHIEDISSTAQ